MHVTETERFLVALDDNWQKWEVKPLQVSGLWESLLGPNWDIFWSNEAALAPIYHRFEEEWFAGFYQIEHPVLICEFEVCYSFFQPPGLRALRSGVRVWSDHQEVWAYTHPQMMGPAPKRVPQFLKGIVRTINMVPIIERNHVERRDKVQVRN